MPSFVRLRRFACLICIQISFVINLTPFSAFLYSICLSACFCLYHFILALLSYQRTTATHTPLHLQAHAHIFIYTCISLICIYAYIYALVSVHFIACLASTSPPRHSLCLAVSRKSLLQPITWAVCSPARLSTSFILVKSFAQCWVKVGFNNSFHYYLQESCFIFIYTIDLIGFKIDLTK